MSDLSRIEYIEARRVLLDVLSALREQLEAVVRVGAQAVYLRTAGRLPTYKPFTTDADIVVDPGRLTDRPALGATMTAAGFVLTDEPGIWEARFSRPGIDHDVVVPIDSFRWRSPPGRVDDRLASPVSTASTAPERAKGSKERWWTTARSRSPPSTRLTRGRS